MKTTRWRCWKETTGLVPCHNNDSQFGNVNGVIVEAAHFRAMQRIVRNAADMPCKCVAVNLNNCLSCQARKVRGK